LTLLFIALTDIFIILDIPILRQVFGFALLTFLPGFLIIRMLRFGNTPLEKMLFLIGLSVSFLLFVPLLLDLVCPTIGISRPISLSPLVTTFSVILVGLSLAAYKKGSLDLQINAGGFKELIGKVMPPSVLGAALIILVGILGGLSLMFYLDSIFSLLLALSIVLIVILIITDKVSPRFYPLYILAIAVALQYSRTLAWPQLFGTDAMFELYFANLVKLSGFWNPSFAISQGISDYYPMLSVSILPNVYSILLNLATVWVFKLIYPFIFAFVPLGLYEIFKTHVKFSSKSAFIAVFIFMSFYAFFIAMPIVTRQEIAELFFVLAALLIMNRYAEKSKKAALLILFIGSMAVSHYSTSYLFLFYIGAVGVGSAFLTSRTRQKRAEPVIPVTIVVLAVIITFSWYIFAGAGSPYLGLTGVVANAFHTLSTQFFAASTDPQVVSGLGGNIAGLSLIHALARYWQIITEVFIVIGLASVIWRRKTPKMSPQFLLFSLASFLLLLVVVALPSVGGAINGWRTYSIALFFLAPYCIFGVEAVVETVSGWLGANRGIILKVTSVALIVVFVPYFLFSYNFVNEIVERPANYAFVPTQNLNGRSFEYINNVTWSYLLVGPVPTESVLAGAWISGHVVNSSFYTDWISQPELVAYGNVPPDSVRVFSKFTENVSSNSFVYLGAVDVQQQSIFPESSTISVSLSSVPGLAAASRVYDNGRVEIYRT